jgi:hypothetical protein
MEEGEQPRSESGHRSGGGGGATARGVREDRVGFDRGWKVVLQFSVFQVFFCKSNSGGAGARAARHVSRRRSGALSCEQTGASFKNFDAAYISAVA